MTPRQQLFDQNTVKTVKNMIYYDNLEYKNY